MHNEVQYQGSCGYLELHLILLQEDYAKMSLDYGKMRSHIRLLKSLRRVTYEFKNFNAFSHFYLIHLLMREDWMFFDVDPSEGCTFLH